MKILTHNDTQYEEQSLPVAVRVACYQFEAIENVDYPCGVTATKLCREELPPDDELDIGGEDGAIGEIDEYAWYRVTVKGGEVVNPPSHERTYVIRVMICM